jgi:hypothetical protein
MPFLALRVEFGDFRAGLRTSGRYDVKKRVKFNVLRTQTTGRNW